MNETSGPRRLQGTEYGLALYAVFSLTSMAMMSIGAALFIAGLILDPSRGGARAFAQEFGALFKSSLVRRYSLASVLLIAACTASLIGARFAPLTYGDFAPIQVHWLGDLAKMWYFAFPLALLLAWKRVDESWQARVLRIWFVCFGVISAIGVLQFFTGIPRAQANPLLPGYFHPVLFLGHHLSVASIWIFPFFAGLDLLFNQKLKNKIHLPQAFVALAMFCGAFTLLFSYSRTLWVAMPVGLAIWSVLRLPRKTATVALAALLLLGFSFYHSDLIQLRLKASMGVDDRVALWKANWEFFKSRPSFGVGFGKNQGLSFDYFRFIHPGQTDFFVGHAHNLYLEIIAGTGLLGAFAWLFWVSTLLGGLLRVLLDSLPRRTKPGRDPAPLSFPTAALAAWIVFLINGITQVNFWEGKVLHAVMWMAGLILYWAFESEPCYSPIP